MLLRHGAALLPITLASGCALLAGLGDYTQATSTSVTSSGHGGGGAGGTTGTTSATTGTGGTAPGECSEPVMPTPGARAAELAVGGEFVCARLTNGEVWCWGKNDRGQLGTDPATLSFSGVPVQVPGIANAEHIAAGAWHACAALADASVICWGLNRDGQAGQTPEDAAQAPKKVSGVQADGIAASSSATCAFTATEVVCWGLSDGGSLGRWSTSASPLPTEPSLAGVTALSAGPSSGTMCATSASGVSCWGEGVTTPTQITATAVKGVAPSYGGGKQYVFVLGTDGKLRWTKPSAGAYAPLADVTTISGAKLVSAGDLLCVVTDAGDTQCAWFGGDPSQMSFSSADAPPNAVEVRVSDVWACVRTAEHAYCDAPEDVGLAGDGRPATIVVPRKATLGGKKVTSLSAGSSCIAAKLEDGSFEAFGLCDALGPDLSGVPPASVPVQIVAKDVTKLRIAPRTSPWDGDELAYALGPSPGLLDLGTPSTARLSLAPGDLDAIPCGSFDVALHADGRLTFFAAAATANDDAVFGEVMSVAPGQTHDIAGPYAGVAAAIYAGHVCAWTAQGRLDCWGKSEYHQAGAPDANGLVTTPTEIDLAGEKAAEAVVGADHTCVRTASGRVRCWGYNSERQAGGGAQEHIDTPAPIAGISDATHLAVGVDTTCATSAAGGVVCWGRNSGGEAGNGNLLPAVPTAIPCLAGVKMKAIVAALHTTCALTDDGATVYCWGTSAQAQVGDGTVSESSGFVQVKGL